MISVSERVLKPAVKAAIFAYQKIVSPALHALAGPGSGCRFVPTCSSYMDQAVQRHGMLKGGALGFKRLCACHPFGRSGWDPVPPAKSEVSLKTGKAIS